MLKRSHFNIFFLSLFILLPVLTWADIPLQLLVVTTNGWETTTASLQRYERTSEHHSWQAVGPSIQSVVGKNGLGLGVGVEEQSLFSGPQKKEGDLKAPAGKFPLKQAFGFAQDQTASFINLPYLPLKPSTIVIDDPDSKYYNQILDMQDLAHSEINSSYEAMGLEPLYQWGMVVSYNEVNPIPLYGSCIFMHIWKEPSSGTAGCTAMSESDLLTILQWIKIEANPMLVQLPNDIYLELIDTWELPSLL